MLVMEAVMNDATVLLNQLMANVGFNQWMADIVLGLTYSVCQSVKG